MSHPTGLRQHQPFYQDQPSYYSSPSPSPPSSPTFIHSLYRPCSFWSAPIGDHDLSVPYPVDSTQLAASDRFPSLEAEYMSFDPTGHDQQSIPALTASRSQMVEESAVAADFLAQWREHARWSPRGHRKQLNHLGSRAPHKRVSSDSSLGSVGPDSPYPVHLSYPRIVDLDSSSASSPHPELLDGGYSLEQLTKPCFPPQGALPTDALEAAGRENHYLWPSHSRNLMEADAALTQAMEDLNRSERSHSFPDSDRPDPAVEEERSRRSINNHPTIAKLDRTMSDIYQDELYHPTLIAPAVAPPRGRSAMGPGNRLSPYSAVFSERLQAANESHLSARSASPVSTGTREPSPFRQTSEFAADEAPSAAAHPRSPRRDFNPAASMNEPAVTNASARDHHYRSTMAQDRLPSDTISPKEAFLDYREAEEAAEVPLIPHETLQKRETHTKSNPGHLTPGHADHHDPPRRYENIPPHRRSYLPSSDPTHAYMPSTAPGHVNMPPQYPVHLQPAQPAAAEQQPPQHVRPRIPRPSVVDGIHRERPDRDRKVHPRRRSAATAVAAVTAVARPPATERHLGRHRHVHVRDHGLPAAIRHLGQASKTSPRSPSAQHAATKPRRPDHAIVQHLGPHAQRQQQRRRRRR